MIDHIALEISDFARSTAFKPRGGLPGARVTDLES